MFCPVNVETRREANGYYYILPEIQTWHATMDGLDNQFSILYKGNGTLQIENDSI